MQEIPIRNFLGLNLRDAADKVRDNEFTLLQNAYQPTKGVLARRFGSVADQTTGFDLANRISGVWRHYGQNGERVTLYHCEPNTSLFPDNTVDLTLADLNDGLGNIFGGGAVTDIRVCYSWIGRGIEQTYNTRNRASFPASGSFPLDAWSNPAHQVITLGGNTHSLRVTVPAFPAGVTGANIFLARGNATQMCWMGTVTTSAGSITLREFIIDNTARDDVLTAGYSYDPYYSATGSLRPGTYRVALAWVVDNNLQEGNSQIFGGPTRMYVRNPGWVTVSEGNNAIRVTSPTTASAFGAKAVYVFIGTQVETLAPLTCVGVQRINTTVTYDSIPATNAQTAPFFQGPEKVPGSKGEYAYFQTAVNSQWIGAAKKDTQNRYQARHGFLLAKTAGGSIREIHPSRTHWDWVQSATGTQMYYGDSWSTIPPASLGYVDLHNLFPAPRTANDRFQTNLAGGGWTQPYTYGRPAQDPNFCYHLGMTYFANGADIPWMTDGYVLGQIYPAGAASQTMLPPPPKFLLVFQSSLVAFGALNDNLLYQANANSPQNWAVGGTGSALRFVPIGDAMGSGGTACGIFTPETEATSNPSSWLIGFKKNGTWMISGVPDPTANTISAALSPQIGASAYTGSPMQQVSGRVGCVAYRSIVQTPIGTLFVGSDANIYRINAVREPQRIGGKIQNALSHLVSNDTLMKRVTAVFHDNHYKISYPSSGSSVNDRELWADLRTDEGDPIVWTGPHIGRNIGPQVVLVGESDNLSRLYADESVVRAVTADSSSTYADLAANGSAQAIAWKVMSKIFRFSTESHIKRIVGALMDLYVDFAFTNTVLFEGWADSYYQQVNRTLSTGGAVWDSSMFDQTFFADAEWMGFSFLFGPDNLIGRTFQWQLSSSDQAPLILSAALMQVKAERRTIVG